MANLEWLAYRHPTGGWDAVVFKPGMRPPEDAILWRVVFGNFGKRGAIELAKRYLLSEGVDPDAPVRGARMSGADSGGVPIIELVDAAIRKAAVRDPDTAAAAADIIERNLYISEVDDIIGSGANGAAGALGDRVLKVTTDRLEIESSAVIVGLELEHVARIDAAAYLGDLEVLQSPLSGLKETFPLGVVLLERLQPPEPWERWDEVMRAYLRVWGKYQVNAQIERSLEEARPVLEEAAREMAHELSEIGGYAAEAAQGIQELIALGVYAVDVHWGNIGYDPRTGAHKLFDLGVSSPPPGARKPIRLNGRRP